VPETIDPCMANGRVTEVVGHIRRMNAGEFDSHIGCRWIGSRRFGPPALALLPERRPAPDAAGCLALIDAPLASAGLGPVFASTNRKPTPSRPRCDRTPEPTDYSAAAIARPRPAKSGAEQDPRFVHALPCLGLQRLLRPSPPQPPPLRLPPRTRRIPRDAYPRSDRAQPETIASRILRSEKAAAWFAAIYRSGPTADVSVRRAISAGPLDSWSTGFPSVISLPAEPASSIPTARRSAP
jgi:hypothetical protein